MNDIPVFEPLFSRRIWEFDTDEIRLSAMSNTRFVAHLQSIFHFDQAKIESPSHQDRARQPIWPPGLVFELGVGPVNFTDDPGKATDEVAFRRLSIEANRISIEVAGKTGYADQLMDYLRFLLSEIRTPEGVLFIGSPRHVKDFSLVVINHAENLISSLLPPPVVAACSRYIAESSMILLPEMSIRVAQADTPVRVQDRPDWTIKPRFGMAPEKAVLESHAWLSSDDHIAMLTDLSRSQDISGA